MTDKSRPPAAGDQPVPGGLPRKGPAQPDPAETPRNDQAPDQAPTTGDHRGHVREEGYDEA